MQPMLDRPLGPPVTEPELYLILGVWGTRSPLGDVSRRVTMPHVVIPAGNKLAPAGPLLRWKALNNAPMEGLETHHTIAVSRCHGRG